jgi:hypothetical protein
MPSARTPPASSTDTHTIAAWNVFALIGIHIPKAIGVNESDRTAAEIPPYHNARTGG